MGIGRKGIPGRGHSMASGRASIKPACSGPSKSWPGLNATRRCVSLKAFTNGGCSAKKDYRVPGAI